MPTCRQIAKQADDLAALAAAEVPADIRDHLAACPRCRGSLAAARLTRGLLAAAAEGAEPPAGFAPRVAAALPAAPESWREDPEGLWRAGRGLVPAFAALAAALLLLYEVGGNASPLGLLNTEGLPAGQRLVLEAPALEPEVVLSAVIGGDGE